MTQFSSKLVSLFTVALVLSFAATAIAAPARPFKAKGETHIVAGDPLVVAMTAGTGTATHLGKFTSEGTVTFTPIDAVTLFGEGVQIYTAANGDKLQTTFCGVLDLTTGEATVFSTITGGTGRFDGATGSFTTEVSTTGPGAFSFVTAEGTIKY